MSSIVRQVIGNNVYLYESVSYRNEDGKPRNKRALIGKIDPVTGQPIYKAEYVERMAASGIYIDPGVPSKAFTVQEIRQSSVLEFGAQYLFNNMAQDIGLLTALKNTLPKAYQEIFMLACYLVAAGEPFLYCEEWLSKTAHPDIASLSSQRISELMQMITQGVFGYLHISYDNLTSFFKTHVFYEEATIPLSISAFAELFRQVK